MFMGCHSDSGFVHEPRGFYAQMIFGESFEKLPPDLSAPPKGVRHITFSLHDVCWSPFTILVGEGCLCNLHIFHRKMLTFDRQPIANACYVCSLRHAWFAGFRFDPEHKELRGDPTLQL
jgi:hypothetical protein